MRAIFLLWLILSGAFPASCQESFHRDLFKNYETYKEGSLTHRRFKHRQIEDLIGQLPVEFKVEEIGRSVENKPIYAVAYGQGEIKILLWSQMHGDEPTATMAMMDLFRFLQADDQFNPLRKRLRKRLSLVFIPVLNPDGADCYTRHNAQDIDLNRDALNLESPEARLLKSVWEEVQPDWGFNLHDQNRYYAAGPHPRTAAISFLAPAYNREKDVNTVRGRSMQLIGWMNNALQEFIPDQVAKYQDDFEPRAFGDNFQKWGTSTILIESGWLPGDSEKQEIRKLNFVALLAAFQAIAGQDFRKVPLQEYHSIPFNEKNAFVDLAIRRVAVEQDNEEQIIDIGIRRNTYWHKEELIYFNDRIVATGDLSDRFAYEDFTGSGHQLVMGKVYPTLISGWDAYTRLDHRQLWREGYTAVRMRDYSWDFDEDECMEELPDHLALARLLEILPEDAELGQRITPGRTAGLILKKGEQVEYVVINGRLIKL